MTDHRSPRSRHRAGLDSAKALHAAPSLDAKPKNATSGIITVGEGGRRRFIYSGWPTPYVAPWTHEKHSFPTLERRVGREGLFLGYRQELPGDRGVGGELLARLALRPGVGAPRFDSVHSARQRRCMFHLRCQVGGGEALAADGRALFVVRSAGVGRIVEGERTTAPPVCGPCAALAVAYCPRLREGYAAAWVEDPQVWGVAGRVYDPQTLMPADAPSLTKVPYLSGSSGATNPRLRLTVAERLAVELRGVTPVRITQDFCDLPSACVPLPPGALRDVSA